MIRTVVLRLSLVALLGSLAGALPGGSAFATPVSACTGLPDRIVCDLYGAGIGTPVQLPGEVGSGVVSIYAFGGVQLTAQLLFGDWDGTSLFLDPTIEPTGPPSRGEFIRLLRDGCASGTCPLGIDADGFENLFIDDEPAVLGENVMRFDGLRRDFSARGHRPNDGGCAARSPQTSGALPACASSRRC